MVQGAHQQFYRKTYNLYNDGLRIYTTIDSRMQKYAEDAMKTQTELQKNLRIIGKEEILGRHKEVPHPKEMKRSGIDISRWRRQRRVRKDIKKHLLPKQNDFVQLEGPPL